jgi:hypothetical protein
MPRWTQTTEERFWDKVDKDGPLWNGTPCWVWIAHRMPLGYGQFRVAGHGILAHRWAYEACVGPIPKHLELDHLCRNRPCVSPKHLEAVTHSVNNRRGFNHQLAKTHCPHGHPYDLSNTRIVSTKKGRGYQRICNACLMRKNRKEPQIAIV